MLYFGLTGDVIEGGPLPYEDGTIRVPTCPGLGVRLDRSRLAACHEDYLRLGDYPYDQVPLRSGWTPLIPNDRWADPHDDRRPAIPS